MRTLLTASAFLLALAPAARADVKLPAVFGSHMVLQRDKPIVIWGWADPAEKVTVTLGEAKAEATADDKGNWKVTLPARKADAKGITLTAEGKNKVTLDDVLVGEVWLGSGQSNMEWSVAASADPKATIAAATHPMIRLLHVKREVDKSPRKDIPVTAPWRPCTPANVPAFSAVLYHFGVRLQKDLDVPVGLINSSWGGSAIEPWLHGEKTNGGMYNAMIHPIAPLAMRGLLWYQGESNMGQGMAYRDKTADLIKGWREAFGQELPFYFVQIAPWSGYNPSLPLSPTAKGVTIDGGKMRVPLAGLARIDIKDGKPTNRFEVAGEKTDKGPKFIPAEVTIEKDELVIAAKGVETPIAARYSIDLLPEFWEAQCACLKLPGTGMAVTTDIVHNIGDIHPKNKLDVGNRLARWALNRTYGKKDVVVSGPLFKGIKIDGSKAVVSFAHAAGLKARDDKPLTEFEIAGEDGRFYTASAVIEGDKVVVSSKEVTKPTQVRFGWRKTTNPNLCNKEGLPATPFRSKGWKGGTGEIEESASE